MVAQSDELIAEFNQVRGVPFPGSRQAQERPWSIACHAVNEAAPRGTSWSDPLGSFFYTTPYHTDFDPDWPIQIDWPTVVRGLRSSLHASQTQFAELCMLGRATVERWESGRTKPFRGNPLQFLSLVRPHVATPVQAGQLLNLAAAGVLPRLTRPTAEYSGIEIASWLRSGNDDHTDLADPLLQALVAARIIIPIAPSGNGALGDTYFPLAGRFRDPAPLPGWAGALITDVESLTQQDRELVQTLARRLAAKPQ